MREREPLTAITRRRVLNRFDQRLQNHRHWSEEGFQLRGDFADSLVFFPALWTKQGMAEQVAACRVNASRCAARRRSRQNGV
jgi:hypothetical protein